MNTQTTTLARRLALIPAGLIPVALLLYSNVLPAAQAAEDPQSQARSLLLGAAGDRPAATEESIATTHGDASPSVDPQEQARRMILGTRTRTANDAAMIAQASNQLHARSEAARRTYADPQESARRMILGPGAASASRSSVSLTQSPLVMRLNKDEFRIAFGINAEQCKMLGCRGSISYRIDWATEDGTLRSEHKRVDYTAAPGAGRAIAVDHQIFDTAEGQHTTQVLSVNVDDISRGD